MLNKEIKIFWKKVTRETGSLGNNKRNNRKNNDKKRYYIGNSVEDVLIMLCFALIILWIIYLLILNVPLENIIILPFLLASIIVGLLIYLILPFVILSNVIFFIILKIYLKYLTIKKELKFNIPQPAVIVLGKSSYFSPKYWISPDYTIELAYLIYYLRATGEKFSIYKDIDKNVFDKIMENRSISIIYLLGHGSRHSFKLNKDDIIYYCEYSNKRKFKKEYIYQFHCNHGTGKSLVEYVVPQKRWNECNPHYGYMYFITILDVIIDKLLNYRKYKGRKKTLMKLIYGLPIFLIYVLCLHIITYTLYELFKNFDISNIIFYMVYLKLKYSNSI